MELPYNLPVETILKVDENKIVIEEDKVFSQVLSPASFASHSTQYKDEKNEFRENTCNYLSADAKQESSVTVVDTASILIKNQNSEMSMVIREWPLHTNDSHIVNHKLEAQTNFNLPISCNIQALPIDENFFLQFDYKTRNKLKTKQRRLDPLYRSQERIRQKTVMHIKRQDPRFRAAEREKGRYRMRLKRLDPAFRSRERECQRERMKIKRSNPDFREKEREQQKTRLHEKKLDSDFFERDKTRDQWSKYIKRQNDMYSSIYSDKNKSKLKNANLQLATENTTCKSDTTRDPYDYPVEVRNTQAVFPENVNSKILLNKSREATNEAFHFKKQKILNFNFYNSNNEQWAAHDKLSSRILSHIKGLEGSETVQGSPFEAESSNLLQQVNSKTLKSIVSERLVNMKQEELSLMNTLPKKLCETTTNQKLSFVSFSSDE